MNDELTTTPASTAQDTLSQMSGNVLNCPVGENESPDIQPSPDLTLRHRSAIDMLLTGATDVAVAKALSISTRTLHRWKPQNPSFRAELQNRRQSLYADQANRLSNLLSRALDTLERQVQDPWTPTSHRAAATILRRSEEHTSEL